MPTDALSAHEEVKGTINDPIEVATPIKEVQMVEAAEFSIVDMFPDLGPPSPALPPQPLPIVKTIVVERGVDVEIDEVEPNWAAELARRDRQREDRVRELDDQLARHLAPLYRECEDRYRAFEQRWTDRGESFWAQLDGLGRQVEDRVKRHFGASIQAQLGVASAMHDESISSLRCKLVEYIDTQSKE